MGYGIGNDDVNDNDTHTDVHVPGNTLFAFSYAFGNCIVRNTFSEICEALKECCNIEYTYEQYYNVDRCETNMEDNNGTLHVFMCAEIANADIYVWLYEYSFTKDEPKCIMSAHFANENVNDFIIKSSKLNFWKNFMLSIESITADVMDGDDFDVNIERTGGDIIVHAYVYDATLTHRKISICKFSFISHQ